MALGISSQRFRAPVRQITDWIGAHIRAFAALSGVPMLLVPDNTKVPVIKACLYEPGRGVVDGR